MYIAYDFVAHETAYTLNALADDRRTKMSYVKRLCDIRSAVINDDALAFFDIRSETFLRRHLIQILCEKIIRHVYIQKSRSHCLDLGKCRIAFKF